MLSQLLNSLQAQTQAYTYGDHPSPYLGDGIEKSETRAYTHGDSLKHINWKQSIKVQKRQTNRYQKEQHFDIHVYADINANRTE